jgi:hypothetical protein
MPVCAMDNGGGPHLQHAISWMSAGNAAAVNALRTAIKAWSNAGMTLGPTCQTMLGALATQTEWRWRHVRRSARKSAKLLQHWNMRTATSAGAAETSVQGVAIAKMAWSSQLPEGGERGRMARGVG